MKATMVTTETNPAGPALNDVGEDSQPVPSVEQIAELARDPKLRRAFPLVCAVLERVGDRLAAAEAVEWLDVWSRASWDGWEIRTAQPEDGDPNWTKGRRACFPEGSDQ